MHVRVSTLVGGDERNILSSGGHTEDLVTADLSLYLCQVAKGTGDPSREVGDIRHLHQQLFRERKHTLDIGRNHTSQAT